MFGTVKVKIDTDLWKKIKAYSAAAGYSSPTEFVNHALEKEFALFEEAETDEEIRNKLKGLGYLK
jgi:hypothetical protein